MQGRAVVIGLLAVVLGLAWLVPAPLSDAHGPSNQGTPPPEVYAEALGQANLRAGPGIEYPVVGGIVAGARYRVLARHTYVPWLRVEYTPAAPGEAWVYADLMAVTGSLALVPTVGDFPPLVTGTPVPPTSAPTLVAGESPPSTGTPSLPTPTPTIAGAVATTLGEANVRYGPGIEYPAIVQVPAGSSFRVLEFHTVYEWVHIALPDAPQPSGWIFNGTVEITGDTSRIPWSTATQFRLPDLTPTPQTVVVSGAPWDGAPVARGDLASTLGEEMHAYLLEQKFVPYTDQLGTVFVMDLQTSDTFTLNDGVAYSGMSLTKIPILAAYFQRHVGPLTWDEAYLIANTMMCSENATSNKLLELIGDGDPLRGAQRVTAFMQSLNLSGTFIMRQYVNSPDEAPTGAGTITTGADQTSAQPDSYNQVVPKDLGWLLAGIYQCALDGTGLLMDRYPDDFTVHECRQMLQAMDANVINVFIEAGVPPGTRVLHKHGWIKDTHGDAGIVIGPNGAYVFVAVLYKKTHLMFNEASSPVIAELSRMAWNHFNPAAALAAPMIGIVPLDCDPRSDPVLDALLSASLPAPGP